MKLVCNYYLKQYHANKIFGNLLTIEANPAIIKKQIKKTTLVKNDWMQPIQFFNYFIINGYWDAYSSNFCEDRTYIEMLDLYNMRTNYMDSYSYKKIVDELKQGNARKDMQGIYFNSLNSIKHHFNYYLGLLDSMEKEGYHLFNKSIKSKGDTDIGVAISRNGEMFHFRTGHHRLSLAKLIKLKSVTVKVHLVHEIWVYKQKEIYGMAEIESIKMGLKNLRKSKQSI